MLNFNLNSGCIIKGRQSFNDSRLEEMKECN